MRFARMVFFAVLAVTAGDAFATEAPSPRPLRVAVYDVPPYGYVDSDGSISGVSVDLWRRIAQSLEREFELTPVSDMDSVLRGLEQDRFDAAIGAITITPEREERVDFSYPAHRSGVAVAVRKETGPLSVLAAYGTAISDLSLLIVSILMALLLAGFGMWAIERPSRAEKPGESAIATLHDGLYWAVVTMTTVGYGDKTPKTASGRVMATLWMFGSLVLVSLLSTSLVSQLTADRVERHDIASSTDLLGKRLAAVTQSSGAEYLDGLHLDYMRVRDLPEALDALVNGHADAVVNSVGALRYFVSKRYSKTLEVSRGLLAPAYMAVALPHNSPLKKPIDRALIKITGSPEWVSLEERFFDR